MGQVVINNYEDKIKELVQDTGDYYLNTVLKSSEYVMVRRECKNRHEMCSAWAVLGECDNNPFFMKKHCAIACKSCLYLDIKHRCPLEKLQPVWEKGKGH